MRDISDLLKYITGMDVRIGLPNEHTENNEIMKDLVNPMYSTGIGLILESIARDKIKNKSKKKTKVEQPTPSTEFIEPTPQPTYEDQVVVITDQNENYYDNDNNDDNSTKEPKTNILGDLKNAAVKWFNRISREIDE